MHSKLHGKVVRKADIHYQRRQTLKHFDVTGLRAHEQGAHEANQPKSIVLNNSKQPTGTQFWNVASLVCHWLSTFKLGVKGSGSLMLRGKALRIRFLSWMQLGGITSQKP